jgi:hypothetical protein
MSDGPTKTLPKPCLIICSKLWKLLTHVGDVELVVQLDALTCHGLGETVRRCRLAYDLGGSEQPCDVGSNLVDEGRRLIFVRFGFTVVVTFIIRCPVFQQLISLPIVILC